MNAAVSKTVSGEIPPTGVRIPPSSPVLGHRRPMSREIVDVSGQIEYELEGVIHGAPLLQGHVADSLAEGTSVDGACHLA